MFRGVDRPNNSLLFHSRLDVHPLLRIEPLKEAGLLISLFKSKSYAG